MPVPLFPCEPPIGVNHNPNLTFRFPANRLPPTHKNQSALPSIGQTPRVDTRHELSKPDQVDSNATGPRSKPVETSIGRLKSPLSEGGPSTGTPRAADDIAPEVDFELPGDFLVEESNEPNLRDLYLKGQTYTLAMIVEEVLSGIGLFGGKANKYQICIKRIYTLGRPSAPAGPMQMHMSEWDVSDSSDKNKASDISGDTARVKAKQRESLAKHAEKWYSEMEEEGERLRLSLRSLLEPLEKSVEILRNSIEQLPSLSDPTFWADTYDEKLKRALEWDAVVQKTTLEHMLPQYLPVYIKLTQVLTREFPTPTAILEIIPDEDAGLAMAHLVRTIFRTALKIRFQAKQLSSLTRHLTSKLQNCLMSLQWHTKQLLGVLDCTPFYRALRQEAEGAKKPEGEQRYTPHAARDKRIVIIGTLSHIILTLRQLRLSDDKHITTLPTSYLDISVNTEESESPTFHQEEKQILACLTDFNSSVEFLNKYLKTNADTIDPKFLLPFFLEMGAYTRGTMLTQADKLLSGWVVWREICLTVGGWESMQARVNTQDQNMINYALLGMHPGDDISRANSILSASTNESSSNIESTVAKGKGPVRASEPSESFKHKFSFTPTSTPPTEELAPKGSHPKGSVPPFDPIPQLSHQASQRLGTEFSLATAINGLKHLAGPPQKIWPSAALAVQSKGVVSRIEDQTLVYIPDSDDPPKARLDENFSLEEVLRFYAAAMETQKMMPFSVPGSSVARTYWQMKELDEDRKRNEELIDAILAEPAPLKNKRGSDKTQQASSMERKQSVMVHMIQRLSRFTFGKSASTESVSATPTKSSTNPNTLAEASRISNTSQTTTKTSPESANPVPAYSPPSLAHLDSEQISSITNCFNLRTDFRDTLRRLSEMKTAVKCLYDGENFMREYPGAALACPMPVLDREWAWRKIPKDTSSGTANGKTGGRAGGGNRKKRIELD